MLLVHTFGKNQKRMLSIDPKKLTTAEFHGYLLGAVAPRPIAFASTIDGNGNVNLSPFSFFNAFSANPPILVFSPARRVRDNTTKHTLDNCLETGEVVINIVNYSIVEQMSLSSTEYGDGVNEFIKSGLTELPSERIKPPRVAESPASFECEVREVIKLGNEGGAGNLIVCEVVMAHFQNEILDTNSKIDPFKLDAVARMGGNWYSRAQGDSLFEIPKPIRTKGIGVDQIPENIRNSDVLTGNNLGRLGNVESKPTLEEAKEYQQSNEAVKGCNGDQKALHQLAKQLLESGNVDEAWKVLI